MTSKFIGQLSIFFIGFLVAWLGGYFYTYILFEPTNPGLLAAQFTAINLLLFVWLSSFVTITLVCSTVASNVTTAGGMAIIGSILLLLFGSIPQFGSLLPGALISWANQIPLDTVTLINGGALATSLVILLVGLTISIAWFEQQDLP